MTLPPLEGFKPHASIPHWYVSDETFVAGVGRFSFALQNYDGEADAEEFALAMRNFETCGEAALRKAEADLFAYYEDTRRRLEGKVSALDFPEIRTAADVWRHVTLAGAFVHVRRRKYGNRAVYVLVEGSCAWDDRGLSIVLREGNDVTRVSAYDGHLSNADAYAMPDLEHVVYASTRHFAAQAYNHPPTLLGLTPFSWCCCGTYS
eukprot:CAMPEP_0118903164 /NCGR_PEP_ID=MMETSP1166-20130328/8145_1 /TAXON_ID=1104430 /ORGANISM="Chrysoreinhardia sp, Strain CCMP3193" /LENGTH=205 /DNA_ID=CAMNT_0006842389 /DNA_START=75 /DNA_END=692 /DNA_ORIENTATION=-